MNRADHRGQTRVLIVDDSAFMRSALARMISRDPNLSVVGAAATGTEALQKIASLNPDVVTLDAEMPGLDGLQTLRRIMAEFPRPVIMVSSVTEKDAEVTINALAAGAFDYVPKRLSGASLDIFHISDDLTAKIKAAGESRYSRAQFSALKKSARSAEVYGSQTVSSGATSSEGAVTAASIVAIGASTGGPKALPEILPSLPADLLVPILIVQHMPLGFTAAFAERLNRLCTISVRQAAQGETIRPGVVYFAPAGSHMTVERLPDTRVVICLSDKPADQVHTPSIDLMMQSVASVFRTQAMGVIMTGMGSDGALGMNAIHRAGGLTVGQDVASCAVYGMPRVCAEMRILDKVVPLTRIIHEILQATQYHKIGVS